MLASSKVAGTPEIMENILLNLPFEQLFTIQRVNKTVKAQIENSPALRRQMLLENPRNVVHKLLDTHYSILKKRLSPFLLLQSSNSLSLVIDLELPQWVRRGGKQTADLFCGCYPCEQLHTWRKIKSGRIRVELEEISYSLGSYQADDDTTMGDIADWAIATTLKKSRLRTRRKWWLRPMYIPTVASNVSIDQLSVCIGAPVHLSGY